MRPTALALLVLVTTATAATGAVSARGAEVPVPRTYGDAMRWYRDAARAGYPKAMFYLGLTLEQGLQDSPRPHEAA